MCSIGNYCAFLSPVERNDVGGRTEVPSIFQLKGFSRINLFSCRTISDILFEYDSVTKRKIFYVILILKINSIESSYTKLPKSQEFVGVLFEVRMYLCPEKILTLLWYFCNTSSDQLLLVRGQCGVRLFTLISYSRAPISIDNKH